MTGALLVAAFLVSPPGRPVRDLAMGGSDDELRAVIVDQLSLTSPNPAFAEKATSLLESAGYTVDYVPGDQVTIGFYRTLPKGDYDLVVLRTHSTAEISRGEEDVTSVSLFTNEPYSDKLYYEEQVAGRIGFAQYSDDGPKFFGITGDFVRKSMEGRFRDTTVVMMGCQGYLNQVAAEAFASKGAGAFIAWDGLVSADHTDEATQHLLQHLIADGNAPEDAIAKTMFEVGPDPAYGSRLIANP